MTITGQVTDINTGGGLPGATIAVNGTAVGQTDSNGNFSISVNASTDNITASSVGYSPLTQSVALVQETGLIQLSVNPQALPAVTVTPGNNASGNWLILAGIAVVAVASTEKPHRMSGKGSNLIPIAALGLGAYLVYTLTKPSTPVTTAPYAPATGSGAAASASNLTGLSSIFSSISKLFTGSGSGSSTPGFAPVGVQQTPGVSSNPNDYSPASGITTINPNTSALPINSGAYDDSTDDLTNLAGDLGYISGIRRPHRMGDTSNPGLFGADQIVGKTLVANTTVPVYNTPGDSQTPVGYISSGQSVGVVYSWLDANPSEDMQELWWMFIAPNDDYAFGDANGYYYVPHKAGYFNVQDLVDQGALTAAQATALANGTQPSTAETLLNKYLPWVIGGLVAVGLGKAVINKVI